MSFFTYWESSISLASNFSGREFILFAIHSTWIFFIVSLKSEVFVSFASLSHRRGVYSINHSVPAVQVVLVSLLATRVEVCLETKANQDSRWVQELAQDSVSPPAELIDFCLYHMIVKNAKCQRRINESVSVDSYWNWKRLFLFYILILLSAAECLLDFWWKWSM